MNLAGASLAFDARALALLDACLAQPAPLRLAWLAERTGDDAPLQARVLRLLAHCGPADDSATLSGGVSSQALAAPLLAGLHRAAAQPAGLQAGQLLAGWRLLRELGRGGMAVVWLAERADASVKRTVALKLPLAAHLSATLAERFARERDVLAPLVHPHIARLYDAGVADNGQPFLVLEQVVGLPINQFADERHLSTRQRLQLFTQVLAAVAHAHRHLVVHRDLKPANILVDDDGQAKLLDFGIAKLLQPNADAAQLTQEAATVMTPRYAAPEQVAGQSITTATDVYAAGVVLYELLTGQPPHAQALAGDGGLARLAQAVLHETPPPPSRAAIGCALRRTLAGDIDTVVMTALHKEPGARYASAERFAEDIRRLLANEPILAQAVPLWHRARLLLRRHRVAGAVSGLAMVLGGVAAGLALAQYQESTAQRLRGDAVRDFLFQMVSDAEPDETQGAGSITGAQMVDAALRRARSEFAGQPLLRGEVLGELGRIDVRLGRDQQAQASLGEAIQVLQSHGPAQGAALNKARGHLARLLVYDDGARTEALARQALADCTEPGDDCAKARAYAEYALRDLADMRGHTQAALAHARAAVAASERAFPAGDASIVQALESEATVARNAGRLAEARVAIDRAFGVARPASLSASGRLGLLRLRAILALDLGQPEDAAQQFSALLATGADSGNRLVLNRLLAQARLAQGDAAGALAAAAAALAEPEDGTAGPAQRQIAHQAHARALVLAGRPAEALAELAAVEAGLIGLGFEAGTLERLRTRRGLAEAALHAADLPAAAAHLHHALALHAQAAPAHAVDHAQALDLAGQLALAQGRAAQALAHHLAAARWLAEPLPAAHPWVARNRLLRARAAHAAAPDAASGAALRAAAVTYRSLLPAASSWLPALAQLASLSGPSASGLPPALLL